jgi:hypothetical protein
MHGLWLSKEVDAIEPSTGGGVLIGIAVRGQEATKAEAGAEAEAKKI